MPKITIDAKTAFNPLTDLTHIQAFYKGLALTIEVNQYGPSATEQDSTGYSYGCSYFEQATHLTFYDVSFSVGQDFLCTKIADKDTYRCFFIGNFVQKGFFATVCEVDAIIDVTSTTYSSSGGYKQPQVIKIQKHCYCGESAQTCGPSHNSIKMLRHEYLISSKTPHLHLEVPCIIRKKQLSYTVMNRFIGSELYQVLAADQKKTEILTLKQRMGLTFELYKALKHQVSDLGIIHRDIKPENIIVNMADPLQVNIIDYGISNDLSEGKKTLHVIGSSGSVGYLAPEIWRAPVIVSAATDMYSLTRVLMLLWGGADGSFRGRVAYERYIKKIDKTEILFSAIPIDQKVSLSTLMLDQDIKKLFAQGLMYDHLLRITVDDAIAKFTEIYSKYMKSCELALLQENMQLAAEGDIGRCNGAAHLGQFQTDKVVVESSEGREYCGRFFTAPLANKVPPVAEDLQEVHYAVSM